MTVWILYIWRNSQYAHDVYGVYESKEAAERDLVVGKIDGYVEEMVVRP